MTLAAGTRLGPYEILSPLGAGGMGEVYRARDPKLRRDVAIKVLPESLALDPDAFARFEREALAVASLSHPNILSIFDFGTESGKAYAVMELLEGESLRDRLDAGPLSPKQAVDFGLQIAKGLSAAHEKGVVHRDLKPENLFASRDGHVKILDFGLAKRVETGAPGAATSAPTQSGRTEPGTVMGTAGYMSPEQVRGQEVDHRTDIFSFGAVLYEMLSGRRAFKRDTAIDTMAAIVRDDPPELLESGRSVLIALDHVVRHCLEKDRENRFQSARDIVFALSEASGPELPTSVAQSVASVRRRNRTPIAAAILALLAVAGAVAFWSAKHGGRAGGVRRVAVLPFENLGAAEDDYFADGIADQVRGKLTALPGIEVIARGSSTPYKKTTKTPQEIARELSANYLLTATVRWQKGGDSNRVQVNPELVEIKSDGPPASRWQQPFDAALTDVFQVQSDIATKVAESLGVALGAGQRKQLSDRPTQNLAAYDAFLKGEEASGAMARSDPSSQRRGLTFYDRAVALDPAFALAWARVSNANSLIYANGVPTPQTADRARQAAQKAIELAPSQADGYQAMGTFYRLVASDHARALQEYEKGLRIAPDSASLLRGVGLAEQTLGRSEIALDHLRKAERLDPQAVPNISVVGDILLRLRRPEESRKTYERVLALQPQNLGVIERLAMTYLLEGDLARARAAISDRGATVEATELVAYIAQYFDLVWLLDGEQRDLLLRLSPDAFDRDRAAWAICLAQAYALKGDAAQVRVFAEEARRGFEEQLRTVPDSHWRYTALGLALAYLGRKEEAVRAGLQGVALDPIEKDAVGGPYDVHQLARIYVLVGEHEKAIEQLERLLKIPYFLSPGWLRIDPNFDPLRRNPRFQKLVAGK